MISRTDEINHAIVGNLIRHIRKAKVAFNIPSGDSRLSDDRNYLEHIGRMALDELRKRVEL